MSAGALPQLARAGATVHFVGIGGAGMAGLALLLRSRGATVTGSDRERSSTTADLEGRGIDVRIGHSADNVRGCQAVVHTAAVAADNVELEAARAQGIPVIKRADALAQLVNEGRLIAVAGTHGKTTTTALVALTTEAVGLDPTALVGGRIGSWNGNARIGKSETYVVEADEYDRSFLTLRPDVAVVTSMEADHLDTYSTLEEMEMAFRSFVESVSDDGHLIACADDPGARRCLEEVGGLGYGIGDAAELKAESLVYGPEKTSFSARFGEEPLGEYELSLRGSHNVRNALAALGVILALGLDPRAAAPTLAAFPGVERRFQTVGESAGVTVVDDYAHHPTEVKATLEAARQAFEGRRLVVVFQPHLYSRTRAFAAEFGRALAESDVLFVAPIYPAREEPIPGVTHRLVVDAARPAMEPGRAQSSRSLDEVVKALVTELQPGDVLLTMGAGDVGSVGHNVLDRLGRSHVDA